MGAGGATGQRGHDIRKRKEAQTNEEVKDSKVISPRRSVHLKQDCRWASGGEDLTRENKTFRIECVKSWRWMEFNRVRGDFVGRKEVRTRLNNGETERQGLAKGENLTQQNENGIIKKAELGQQGVVFNQAKKDIQ